MSETFDVGQRLHVPAEDGVQIKAEEGASPGGCPGLDFRISATEQTNQQFRLWKRVQSERQRRLPEGQIDEPFLATLDLPL